MLWTFVSFNLVVSRKTKGEKYPTKCAIPKILCNLWGVGNIAIPMSLIPKERMNKASMVWEYSFKIGIKIPNENNET